MDKCTKFLAMVEHDDGSEETVSVTINKPVEKLTYDEVESAIYDKVDTINGLDDDDFIDEDGNVNVPYSIIDIVVENAEDNEVYPVVTEDADFSKIEKSGYAKYLVLPWAKYALTPEAKLWMELKENGIIDEDAPFEYEKYHKMVQDKN